MPNRSVRPPPKKLNALRNPDPLQCRLVGVQEPIVDDSVLPNFAFDVRVAHDQAERSRILIADAEQVGPAAAEEAERASES